MIMCRVIFPFLFGFVDVCGGGVSRHSSCQVLSENSYLKVQSQIKDIHEGHQRLTHVT